MELNCPKMRGCSSHSSTPYYPAASDNMVAPLGPDGQELSGAETDDEELAAQHPAGDGMKWRRRPQCLVS